MSPADTNAAARPMQWGLSARLFAILLLLGAVAVLVTGGLPVPVANHAERMVRMAIRMVHITREHAMEHHVSIALRVGINSAGR